MGGNGRRQEGGVTGESKAVRQGMAQTGGREGGRGWERKRGREWVSK